MPGFTWSPAAVQQGHPRSWRAASCNTDRVLAMASLIGRKGDAQALKVAIAAAAAGTSVQFSPASDAAAVRAKGSNPFGSNAIAYVAADGALLTEANAIAKLLGRCLAWSSQFSQCSVSHAWPACSHSSSRPRAHGTACSHQANHMHPHVCRCCPEGGAALVPAAQAAAVSHWAEWEATVLRPATYTQGPALQSAIQTLEGAVSSKTHLVGSALTLADVSACVYGA